LQQQVGLAGEPDQLRLDTRGGDDLLQAGQPGAAALAAEHHGIGLTGVEPVHQRVRGHPVGVVLRGQPVVLVNRQRGLLIRY